MTTPLLDIRDLHAGYGKAEVLHGIDLHADAGQVITVIGPNGAGKTTFARNFLPAEAKTLRFINADLIKLRDQEEPILGAT